MKTPKILSIELDVFKKSPWEIFNSAGGYPVEVKDREQPLFVCISSHDFEWFLEVLEDVEFARLVNERSKEPLVDIDLSKFE